MYKYVFNVGDLICCPRKQVEDMWGTCIIISTGVVKTRFQNGKNFYYYNIYSPVRKTTIQMPATVLEESWYIPGNEKALTNG